MVVSFRGFAGDSGRLDFLVFAPQVARDLDSSGRRTAHHHKAIEIGPRCDARECVRVDQRAEQRDEVAARRAHLSDAAVMDEVNKRMHLVRRFFGYGDFRRCKFLELFEAPRAKKFNGKAAFTRGGFFRLG